ncbi:MAG: TonB family protein [Brevinematales bacterium]|nr:TonB family protein [Brevinematales bacterium]
MNDGMFKYFMISVLIHTFVIFLVLFNWNVPFPKLRNDSHNHDKMLLLIKFSLDNQKLQQVEDKKKGVTKQTETHKVVDGQSVQSQNLVENVNEVTYETERSIKTEGQIIPPRILSNPPINYPLSARIKRIEGKVSIEIVISTNGRVKDCNVVQSSGSSLLDNEAIKYVKNILFEPARDEFGNPIEFNTIYVVHFVLR